MAIRDEGGIKRKSIYSERGKSPEAKEYDNEGSFGIMAEGATEEILDSAQGIEVVDTEDEVDEYEKVDFKIKLKGSDDTIKVQFTTMHDPRETSTNLTENQQAQVKRLEEKKENLGDEVIFVHVPGRHFSEAYDKLKDPEESSPEDLVKNMSVEAKIEVIKSFLKSLEQEAESKARDLQSIIEAYNKI